MEDKRQNISDLEKIKDNNENGNTNSNKSNTGKICSIVTVLVFVMMLSFFTIISMLKPDTGYSDTENRVLKSKPEFSMDTLIKGEYTSAYQEYVRDQFPWRKDFVRLKNYCEIAMGKSNIKDVLLCSDDYYIESHPRSNYESEIANINKEAVVEFSGRYVECLGEGHVSVMLVPTAQTVLNNRFKSGMVAYDQRDYIDSIASQLGQTYVNVYDTLKPHDLEYIYYRTDHHWTTYGAYLAYLKWTEGRDIEPVTEDSIDKIEVTTDFLGTVNSKLNIPMETDTITQYIPRDVSFLLNYNMGMKKTKSFVDETFLDGKDKYSYFLGGNPGLVDITSEFNNDKKLLIIKDSYANCIVPVYAATFEKTYVVDLRYFNMDMDEFIEEYGITDILVMYNIDSFATDKYVKRLK